jgi:hypothetical protein
MQCRIVAILRATATFAFFNPIRLTSFIPHARSADHFFVRWSRTAAASYR